MNSEFAIEFPTVSLILNIVYIGFFFAILWIFGRMGDNINKIRKLIENELNKKDTHSKA